MSVFHFSKIIIIALVVCFSISLGNAALAKAKNTAPDMALDSAQATTHPGTAIGVSGPFPAPGKNCLSCHKGLLSPRPPSAEMMQRIYERGRQLGDPNGCVVCHGGDPLETRDKKKAHNGAPKGSLLGFFTPVPGALQVNE